MGVWAVERPSGHVEFRGARQRNDTTELTWNPVRRGQRAGSGQSIKWSTANWGVALRPASSTCGTGWENSSPHPQEQNSLLLNHGSRPVLFGKDLRIRSGGRRPEAYPGLPPELATRRIRWTFLTFGRPTTAEDLTDCLPATGRREGRYGLRRFASTNA